MLWGGWGELLQGWRLGASEGRKRPRCGFFFMCGWAGPQVPVLWGGMGCPCVGIRGFRLKGAMWAECVCVGGLGEREKLCAVVSGMRCGAVCVSGGVQIYIFAIQVSRTNPGRLQPGRAA